MMARFALLVLGLLLVALLTLGYTTEQAQRLARLEQENKVLRALVAPPPRSLDRLFPPLAEQPIFLLGMMGIANAGESMFVDLMENEPQLARAHFDRFRSQYIEVSQMVPEWRERFPLEPVDQLGAALDSGDQEKVMAAFGRLGQVCANCHAANMAKVQQKYHWGNFGAIKVQDPLTSEEVNFAGLMQYLSMDFTGIGADLEEGQLQNAQQHFEGFNARFQTLKTTCYTCHDTERRYYVDEDVQALVDKLGQALSASPPDPQAVGELSQGIGMQSCFRCHLVHMPAALAQAQWAQRENEGK